MSTVNEKMTALANQVRELSGTTEHKTIDDMQLDVQDANEVISSQTDLISEILTAISNLPDALPDTDEKGSADLVIDGAKVTAPAGYYPNGAEASVTTASVASPSFEVEADEEESEIWLRAYNNQQEGYVEQASTYTDQYVKLTIDGNTATMSCGDASIERTVEGGSSVETVSITLTETGNSNDLVAYLTTNNGVETHYIRGGSITKQCIKNSIILLRWYRSSGSTNPLSTNFYQNLNKLYGASEYDNWGVFSASGNGSLNISSGPAGGGAG